MRLFVLVVGISFPLLVIFAHVAWTEVGLRRFKRECLGRVLSDMKEYGFEVPEIELHGLKWDPESGSWKRRGRKET